jgi:hypothetical protein
MPLALCMRRMFVIVVLSVVASFSVLAQTDTATLSGVIADPNGGVVPDVEVIATRIETGIVVTTKTNGAGIYFFTGLMPGHYHLMVRKAGFKEIAIKEFQLFVQDKLEQNFSLEIGSVSETVTVNADDLHINTTEGSVGTVIDRKFVGDLPLNGRSFQSLILLTPGVTVTGAGFSDYGQFSVNGQRASTNYFTVDGVSANMGIGNSSSGAMNGALAGSYPGLSAFGGTNNLVSVDALEEFKILTSTFSAEFGRQPGGQISLVTRAGSNQFRGALFEYFRNDALDATDWFTNAYGLKKPALRQNQFGGTFSGPVVIPGLYDGRDHTFFFFSYEGQRLRLPISGINDVPSLRVRSAAAAAVQPFLNAFPQPTGAEFLDSSGAPIGWAPYAYSISNPSTLDATSIRIDHTFSSKLTLFGRFNESPSNATTFFGGASGTSFIASTRTLTLGTTSALTPRLNNELRFNYSRQLGEWQFIPSTLGGAVPVEPAGLTNGLGGQGRVGFSFGCCFSTVDGGDLAKNYQRQINVVDNVSLVKGAHALKFGIDYRRLSPTYNVQPRQWVFFFSEASLNSATADYVEIDNNDPSSPRFTNFSVYGQDMWRVTPRLTLDLGLRWEVNPAPTLAQGKMPAVVQGITGNPPDVSKATLAPPGAPFYRTFYTAFAPRFGAAYKLNQTSGRETVLRGGFGVYYDLGSAGATSAFPLTASNIVSGVPFPLSASDAARPVITNPTSLPVRSATYSDASSLKLPYTLQWNVALEQSLGTQQSLTLSYVASAARRLLTMQSLNYPASLYFGPRPNPNFRKIFYTWNGPTSDYHSLQVQYKARFRRGLQALVNYTWSHAIDEVSSDIGLGVLSRGNADFDVRHNLSAALTYNVPAPGAAPALKHLFGNWSVDGIVHAQSGQPVNVVSGYGSVIVNGELVDVRPDVVPGQPFYINDSSVPGGRRFNSAAFTPPPSDPTTGVFLRQGDFGRNVLRGLPLSQLDFALGRSFNLTENFKLQFKGELFNIFNHPMFGGYDTNFYPGSTTFGVPTYMLNGSLGGLNALYQLGGPRSVQLSLRLTF